MVCLLRCFFYEEASLVASSIINWWCSVAEKL